MAYLFFHLTKLFTRIKKNKFTKKTIVFHTFVILDMIATTDVVMMRLSYRYICRAPLNIYTIFFCPVIFPAWRAV